MRRFALFYFAQFYILSTGYVKGTIPPQYSKEHAQPIPACGSDGVFLMDNRLNLENMACIARERAKRLGYVGFTIERGGERLFSDAKTVRKLELVKGV